jgi:galactarate dehydratase
MTPLTIRMQPQDNVAIVANHGGLAKDTVLPDGLSLRDAVPQGHKVALVDIPAEGAVLRYGIAIGYALRDIPAGSWVNERLLQMPSARELDNLPIATVKPEALPPLKG